MQVTNSLWQAELPSATEHRDRSLNTEAGYMLGCAELLEQDTGSSAQGHTVTVCRLECMRSHWNRIQAGRMLGTLGIAGGTPETLNIIKKMLRAQGVQLLA